MIDTINTIFAIALLVISAIIHEVAHGYAAYFQGDPTAKSQGRLTLNPLNHIDPFGSVVLPLLLIFTKAGFVFGWAKPVPYNPYNLKNQKWGEMIVSAAGPFVNIAIALIFGLVLRVGNSYNVLSASFQTILSLIVFINLLLALFNLVPIPPLDGSKILFSFIPYRYASFREKYERYGMVLLLFFILFLWGFIYPVIFYIFHFISGVPLSMFG